MPQQLTPDLVLGENEKFLLYGEYGTGKTHLALSAPDPIWAVGIGGLNEFKTRYSKSFIKNVGNREVFVDSVVEYREERGQMADNPNGFDLFCDILDAGLEWNDKQGNIIKTLIIDNATVLEEYMLNKAIAAEFMTANNQAKTVMRTEREYGIRKPQDTTWSGAQSLMQRIVSWLFELPFHIVFVAHERKEWASAEKGSRDRQLIGVGPLFVGQQRIMVPNLFDNVWRTSKSGGGRNAQYAVQSVGDEKVAAKTRVGGILDPALERSVNLTAVIDAFKQHAKELSDDNSK
jgi:hypothetical protein